MVSFDDFNAQKLVVLWLLHISLTLFAYQVLNEPALPVKTAGLDIYTSSEQKHKRSYGDGSCVHAAVLLLNCLIYFKKLLVLMTFHSKQFSFYPGAVFIHSTSFYPSRPPRRCSITLSAPPAHLSPSLFSDSLSHSAPL